MTRRGFLSTTAAGALAAAPARSRKPNFIVFLLDDLGYGDLGCQGATDVKTPNIDALAASGARFTDWYACAPVCAPSRASLLTGRYPQRCGVPGNGQFLRPSEQTIAQVLKPQGYATAAVGKWHLGGTTETDPNSHGFDYYFGFHDGCVDYYSHRFYWGEPKRVNFHDLWRNREEVFEDGEYLTQLITREAKQWLTAHRSEPFFLYVPYNAVHYPMHAPRKYTDRFQHLEPERRTYAAMLSAADDGIGEIMSLVKQQGLLEDTLVIFAGDNGATREPRAGLNQQPAKGGTTGPLRGCKFSVFEGGIRVPMIMSRPGTIPKGQVIREVGMHADLLPTFATAAGASLPSDRTIDGRDILPMATSQARSPHQALYWDSTGQLAVRRGQWKLVLNGTIMGETVAGDDTVFLSNLDADIGERRNMRHEHADMAAQLQRQIEMWRKDVLSP
jgi:arylsulfatase A-like enzyme